MSRTCIQHLTPGAAVLLHHTATSLDLAYNTAHRIVQNDLGYNLYKLQIMQELKEEDFGCRKEFVETFLRLEWPNNTEIVFSNEAHFKLNGNINKQNVWYWAESYPHISVSKSLYSAHVTV